MLSATNISYTISGREILKSCSLTLMPGRFTAIVGANGAGKTTLLKILSKEVTKFKGTVSLNKKNITGVNQKEIARQRAVLPQQTILNFPFTVEQVILIGRYAHNTLGHENDRIVTEVLARTNLTPFKHRIYNTLSGGEQQRVQMARVLAQMCDETIFPKYLMLDEPTASLDLGHQHTIMQLARQCLIKNMGVLAIIHDLNLAAQYADEVIFMKEGKIIAAGKMHDVVTKEIIEETFMHRVKLLYDDACIPVVCPIAAHHYSTTQNINHLTDKKYGELNYN